MRILVSGLCALLGACAALQPGPAVPEWPQPEIPYTEFRLENGLRLIVHEDRSTPIVSVNVWYHVGSKNEPPGRSGFAHLFEHLMFNGSEHYDDEYFRPLEAVGATGMNGTTSEDRTNYFANVPTPALDRLLWLESDRMGHLLGAITQEKLDEQRGVVKNEKRQRENEPYGKVWAQIPALSYPPRHPYSWSPIGSMADLDAATLDDVRDWFSTWYGAANATIVIAGDVEPETARQRVEHFFGGIPTGPTLVRPERWEAPMPDRRRARLTDRVPQSRLYRIYNVAANFTRDAIDLQLAAEILGGGKSSRLYERLVWREELATDVAAFLSPGELGSQLILIATARDGVKLQQLENAIDEELQGLRDAGPTGDELARVRSALYAGVARGLERVGGFGGKSDQLAAAAVIAGDPAMWRTELDWLRSASAGRIRDSLKLWTDAGHLTVSVWPEDAVDAQQLDTVDRTQLPAVDEPPALRFPQLQQRTLENGLRVVVARREGSPVSEYRFMRAGGFAVDPQGQEGLGRLTMDLRDEAAAGKDALELARALERNGAHLSSGASLDQFQVALSTVRGLETEPLQIFSEVLTRPDYPEAEFERRRTLLLARIAQERSRPFSLGLRALPPLLYGNTHPYGRALTGSGTPETLATLNLDGIRQHAQRYIRPEGATLLIVGDWELEAAIDTLPPALREWRVDGPSGTAARLADALTPEGPQIYLIDKPDAKQSVILAGRLVPSREMPDNLALETANALYGGLFTSRLNMNLREDKGWAYGAGSALVGTQAQRPWVIYTRVESAQTAASMREIRHELSKLRQSGSIQTAELLHATRNRALKLPGQHETTAQLAGSISRILSNDLPADYYDTLPAQLQALQPATVEHSARMHFRPEGLRWVIVGDRRTVAPQLQALGWGEVNIVEQTP